MLKQRVLTAAVLGSVVIAVILSGSNLAFMIFMGLCVLLGGREWARLSGQQNHNLQFIYAVLIIIAGAVIIFVVPVQGLKGFIMAGVVWWILASVMVGLYATGKSVIPRQRLLKYLIGAGVLLPVAVSLIVLYDQPRGPYWVMWLFVLIWVVDSAAYFTGRRWGRRHLAPRVSPGKTWEGLAGSLVAAVIMALIGAGMSHNTGTAAIGLVLLFVLATGFSVMGDLFESMFKRESNVKDSGQLLPGHGGVLDRIDSLTAAAPVFTAGLWLLEIH